MDEHGPPLAPVEDGVWSLGSRLVCRVCGYTQTALGVTTRPTGTDECPSDGDFSVCFGCGEVSVIATGPLGVALREPTGEDLAEFACAGHGDTVRRLHRFNAGLGPLG